MIFPAPTPRLVLRAWREEDLGTFTAMNADPRVMEYFPAPLTPEQSAEFMERIREEFSTEGFGLYAVERREDGELLGYTGLHRVTFTGMKDKIEIGWRLRTEFWDQGYAPLPSRTCARSGSCRSSAWSFCASSTTPPCPKAIPCDGMCST